MVSYTSDERCVYNNSNSSKCTLKRSYKIEKSVSAVGQDLPSSLEFIKIILRLN
ncbi:unnamed protein product [Moneuplotes crassus]|uniref:Uncharacterized protein n=1 Tax=Euplotes crassus TaxID=5936 RepID=A0AAD1ULU5_EUPCR|nr:unnamed protein product [Moneuplotes crassus]